MPHLDIATVKDRLDTIEGHLRLATAAINGRPANECPEDTTTMLQSLRALLVEADAELCWARSALSEVALKTPAPSDDDCDRMERIAQRLAATNGGDE